MRKHRVIHKPSKQLLAPNVPMNALTPEGRFYTIAQPFNVFVEATHQVAIDEWTGTLDKKGIEVYENDIVKVGLRAMPYDDKLGDHVGWVEAVAIVVYNELNLGWSLEVLTEQYRNLAEDTDWDIHEVIGNRWQTPEIITSLRPPAPVSSPVV